MRCNVISYQIECINSCMFWCVCVCVCVRGVCDTEAPFLCMYGMGSMFSVLRIGREHGETLSVGS